MFCIISETNRKYTFTFSYKMDTPRRSGIPVPRSGPVYRQGSMESSFSKSNGNLLHSLLPSPSEDLLLQENLALKKQIMELQRRFEKEQSTRDTFETIQFEQKKAIKTYVHEAIAQA